MTARDFRKSKSGISSSTGRKDMIAVQTAETASTGRTLCIGIDQVKSPNTAKY